MKRADRLKEIERLYLLRAYSDADMAEKLGVDRTTVWKDRNLLETQLPFVEVDGRYRIDKTRYISDIRLNLLESLSLYLAARRASRQTRLGQQHMASALEKLALTLRQPMTERLVRAAETVSLQAQKDTRVPILETVTRAWVETIKVRVLYQSLRSTRPIAHVISPYLIEPALWSDGAYLVGYSDVTQEVTPFKIERIEQAALTTERFTIPDTFNEQQLLRYAWGIWYSNAVPVTVKLRFVHGDAARRLQESTWHPTEVVQVCADGDCIWSAQVAEWRELVPWVRGWGADVEVLEPVELREEVITGVKLLAVQYHVEGIAATPAHHLFWGKADRESGQVHRLIYHMIDVGQVALAMWDAVLPDVIKQHMAQWLGLPSDEAGQVVAFWASLHDLGKASPAFQDHPRLSQNLRQMIRHELESAGFNFPQRLAGERRARHEVISTWDLGYAQLLIKHTTLPVDLAMSVAQALGGHHGAWPTSTAFSGANLKPQDKGDDAWENARIGLIQDLASLLCPSAVNNFLPDSTRDNLMLTLLSGIVSIADWLGSDESNFPQESGTFPLESYLRHARQHALYALSRAEWDAAPRMPIFNFQRAFGFTPKEAQRQIADRLKNVPLPALAIIEAPTGSGKTEAALAVYSHWARATGYSGLYIAMPTTATSNQMHTRVSGFLSKQLGMDIEPLLVHSQAILRNMPTEYESIEEQDHEGEQAAAQAWFLPRKKSLLAPFGVGTVDQALMSVLQTKHFFVRLFGLCRKVVIFDEVHAYDVYMSELFERLLVWLRQIGASVIVLSATLSEKTRVRLIQAYAGNADIPPSAIYPCLTWATADGRVDALGLDPPDEKTLHFEWIDKDEKAIVARLSDELCEGGSAVVICNTVGRAQRLYSILNQADEKLCDDDNMILFHARFPLAWREELERKVLDKFGPGVDKSKPNPQRPTKAIVIATQVVEQSLDLDFDVMISDHAPVDLLLQRAGRLQRHTVNDAARKHPYSLLIAEPVVDDGVPRFERSDVWIYDEYILLRTWLSLRNKTAQMIRLPTDLPTLIELVYGDAELPTDAKLQEALTQTKLEMVKKHIQAEDIAEERLVREPSFHKLLYQSNMELEEDDNRIHTAFRALTRNDRPGITVVCLHRVEGKLLLEPDDLGTVYDPSEKTGKVISRELARHSISIRHPDPQVEHCLLAEPNDPAIKTILAKWKKLAVLRFHRVVIFEDGICPLPGTDYVLQLNKASKLGLQIRKEVR